MPPPKCETCSMTEKLIEKTAIDQSHRRDHQRKHSSTKHAPASSTSMCAPTYELRWGMDENIEAEVGSGLPNGRQASHVECGLESSGEVMTTPGNPSSTAQRLSLADASCEFSGLEHARAR